MDKKYKEIFEELVSSYYNDSFEAKIDDLIYTKFKNEKEAKQVIATLCGVEHLENNKKFIYNLKKAITNSEVKKNLFTKLENCDEPCTKDGDSPHCMRVCPFDAILVNPINNAKFIDYDACLACGECLKVCNNGRYVETVEFIPIYEMIKKGQKVIAIVAPAISGQFGENVTLDMLREAFIKIGFTDMMEVAFSADMLSIKEAVEFNKHINSSEDFLITSCCCPMWVGMLKKVYSNLVKDVSPSVSPMIALGRVLKKLDPDVKVVFVGPCLAKKAEAKEKDLCSAIDYVLTFEELKSIFTGLDIRPEELKGIPSIEYSSRGGRLYARAGGVSEAIGEIIEELYPDKYQFFNSVHASGVPSCKELLSKLQNKEISATFIEGMGCVGGCVGGPKRIIDTEKGKVSVNKTAYESPVKIATHSHIMDEILERIGITSLEDFEDPSKIEIFEREFN